MKVTKSSSTGGAWLKKEDLKSGDKLKIVSEAELVEGQLGQQLVVKVRRQGTPEPVNMAVNKTSKNALIEAYGDDTKDWVEKVITVAVERAIINNKRSMIVYLVPAGFVLTEASDGSVTITNADIQLEPAHPVTRAVAAKKNPLMDDSADEDLRDAPLPEDDF